MPELKEFEKNRAMNFHKKPGKNTHHGFYLFFLNPLSGRILDHFVDDELMIKPAHPTGALGRIFFSCCVPLNSNDEMVGPQKWYASKFSGALGDPTKAREQTKYCIYLRYLHATI